VALWKHIAQRYRDNRWVAAYDLLNEPAVYGAAGDVTFEFHNRLIEELRAVDANHVFIVEGDFYGHHFDRFPVLTDPLVAYSCHFYPFFSLDQYRTAGMDARLDAAIASERWVEQVLERLQRLLWCGETGVPMNRGETDLCCSLHDATLEALDRTGISWCVWTYKDARSMGTVVPRHGSPWMKLSERVCRGWSFWDGFAGAPGKAGGVAQADGVVADAALLRRLQFRLLASQQHVLALRLARELQEVPFEAALDALDSWRFENCDCHEALAAAVRRNCS